MLCYRLGGANIGEALVNKGFAAVIRHRQDDDDQRASNYDDLLAAEAKYDYIEI